ncbi:MAG: hypothetical protein AAB613_02940 [Patescibacteria group bacterium]
MAQEELPEEIGETGIPETPVDPGVDDQQVSQPNIIDQGLNAKDQFDQGKELYAKGKEKLAARSAKKAGAKGAKEGLKEGVEKQGAAAAKRKVATRVEGEAAKQAAKAAARKATAKVGASAVAKIAAGSVVPVIGNIVMAILTGLQLLWPAIKKYGKYVIYVVAGLFLLLAIPFGLIGLKGGGQYPATQAQLQQATLVSAVAGDLIAGKKITQEGVDKIKGYYRDLVLVARDKNAIKATEAEKRFKALGDQLDQLINLSGDPQKKLLAQIKAEEKQIFKDFPDLFPVGGTCADLKPFIDSGQFKIGSVNGKSNAKNVIEGVLANKIGEVWPASPGLCATLIYLLKNGVKIGTNTFSLGHEKYSGNKTSGTTISQHWCGEAIDIQSIDGVHVGKNDPTRKAMQLIKQGWMAKVGAYESFGPFYDLQLNNGKSYPKDIGGHDDHIHLSGPPLNKSCYGK